MKNTKKYLEKEGACGGYEIENWTLIPTRPWNGLRKLMYQSPVLQYNGNVIKKITLNLRP